MKSVLFIDGVAPKPYDTETLKGSQGGTESTVTRIAEGLAKQGFVYVEQGCRSAFKNLSGSVRYWSPGMVGNSDGVTRVICLRDPNSLYKARERFPDSKLYLWCHDLFSKDSAELTDKAALETNADLILVSDFHKQQARNVWPTASGPTMWFIYNPIDPVVHTIASEKHTVNPHQLCWFSSPHKGLKQALEIFSEIHRRDSRFSFVVHNPGYLADAVTDQPGVTIKPRGSYLDSLRTVASSLCVLYPNLVFPETFGLVFAEADALSTPVLTHDLGSAREILDHPQEIVDCRNIEKVIERVISWSEGARPLVRANPKFSLSKILSAWEKLLAE